MIFIIWGLILGLMIYLADKYYNDKFLPYLKYGGIVFVGILFAFDIFMFIETDRFIKTREAGGDLGLEYSYFNNVTNLTVSTSMYAKQTIDSGTIVAYHYSEYSVIQYFNMALPYLAIFLSTALVLQYVLIFYLRAKNGE